MPGNSSHIRTGIDRLLRRVREKGRMGLEEASENLGVDRDVVLSWAHALEDAGVIEIHHSAMKGRILIALEPDKTDEDLEEVQKETAEDIQELEELREEETDIEHFQDVLERMERALEEDEEEAEDLDDVLQGDNLETLHDYLDELREAEKSAEKMEERLDSLAARLEALRTAEELGGGERQEETGLVKRLVHFLPWKEETFRCGECGKEFETSKGRNIHRGMVHGD